MGEELIIIDVPPEELEKLRQALVDWQASPSRVVVMRPEEYTRRTPPVGRLRRFIRWVFGTDELLKEIRTVGREIDHLQQEVAEARSVMASATALITGLAARLRDNLNDPVALETMANELDASANALASAVTENTAAANLGGSETTGNQVDASEGDGGAAAASAAAEDATDTGGASGGPETGTGDAGDGSGASGTGDGGEASGDGSGESNTANQ